MNDSTEKGIENARATTPVRKCVAFTTFEFDLRNGSWVNSTTKSEPGDILAQSIFRKTWMALDKAKRRAATGSVRFKISWASPPDETITSVLTDTMQSGLEDVIVNESASQLFVHNQFSIEIYFTPRRLGGTLVPLVDLESFTGPDAATIAAAELKKIVGTIENKLDTERYKFQEILGAIAGKTVTSTTERSQLVQQINAVRRALDFALGFESDRGTQADGQRVLQRVNLRSFDGPKGSGFQVVTTRAKHEVLYTSTRFPPLVAYRPGEDRLGAVVPSAD
jgi:hypothetical protein